MLETCSSWLSLGGSIPASETVSSSKPVSNRFVLIGTPEG